MKTLLVKFATLCGASNGEAAVLLVLSACGWLYFAYAYLYESGLGVGVPLYAGY